MNIQSSGLLTHLRHRLKVSYCKHWMSIVNCQQLLRKTSPDNIGWILTKLGRMILIRSSLIIFQIVSMHSITWSNELKIDFWDENLKKSDLKQLGLEPLYLIYSAHHLVDLYQICSNMALGQKMAPPRGSRFTLANIGENKKILSEGLDIWYVTSPSGPQLSLFKLWA